MMLSLDTAYRSFGGEVEASNTPTICRLPDSRRHQLSAIAPPSMRPGLIWVKVRRTPHEYMSSAFPQTQTLGDAAGTSHLCQDRPLNRCGASRCLMHLAVSEATMRSMTDDTVKRRLT